MKTKTNLLFLLFFPFLLNAQDCYLAPQFEDIIIEKDIVYGQNATALFINSLGEAVSEDLLVDIYRPSIANAPRPLVIVLYDGNFLPPIINGKIIGTKQDSSVVELCTRLAQYGYTAAAISYRAGWNPLAAMQAERAATLIQAIYRGIQDGRTAVRFFRKTVAEDNNPYHINPEQTAVIGIGSSGYIALGMATLDEYTDIIETTHPAGKFLLDLDGDGTVETPMVVEAYHGDIEGKMLSIAPDDTFGFPAGDTLNIPNHVEYESNIQLSMHIGGAIPDIGWLDATDPPIISIQSAFDMLHPYREYPFIAPMFPEPIFPVQGGLFIAEKQEEFGNNQLFYDAEISDVYTDEAIANSALATTEGHPYYEGLYPFVNPPNSFGYDEGVAIDWWDSTTIITPEGLAWNEYPHPSGGTYHSNGLLTNEGMSAEKARMNIEKVIGYFAPRAFVALGLDASDCMPVNVSTLESKEIHLSIFPNPANEEIILTTDRKMRMESVQILDLNGQLIRNYPNVNNHLLFIKRNKLSSGMYVLKIQLEGVMLSKKLLFK